MTEEIGDPNATPDPEPDPNAPRPAEPIGPRQTGDETGGEADTDDVNPDDPNAPREAAPVGPRGTGAETGQESSGGAEPA